MKYPHYSILFVSVFVVAQENGQGQMKVTPSSTVPDATMATPIMLTTSPTTFSTTDSPTPFGLPIALIFSFGVIGALFLLMLLLVGVTIACCVARKRTATPRTSEDIIRQCYNRRGSQVLMGNSEKKSKPPQERPHTYSKVNKLKKKSREGSSPPPPLPPPLAYTPSPQPSVKPQEIVSYNMDIPKTFIPYAPPPPVSGLSKSTENIHKLNATNNPYKIPMDSLADYDEVDSFDGSAININVNVTRKPSRAYSLQSYSSQFQNVPSDDESYYDTVESIHGSPALGSSLRLNSAHDHECHYQSPRRRGGRFSQGNNQVLEPTYIEALEPSMMHSSSSMSSETAALPYGPIYDFPKHLKKLEQPLEISYHNIMEIRDLGNCRFGRVVLAATVDLSLKDLNLGNNTDKNRSFLVAAKKLKEDADEGLMRSFHDEIRFLSRLKHANVVRLLGVCTTNPHSSFMMVEYMENGDLHEFLRKQKLVSDKTTNLQEGEATPLILLYMCVQIASGMRYLASRKFVHRDLATRNCLVGKEFVIKISDFGMSQNLYESYYYRVQGQLILPIRWMPYESFYGKFSIKSDVWAFGVTIWEIYNMAEQEPYSEMDNAEVINDATKGRKRKLLKRPEICPQEVYDVMMRCWVHEPSVRADFEEIYSRLFLAYMTKSQAASY